MMDFPDAAEKNVIQKLSERLARVKATVKSEPVFLLNLRSTNRFVNVYAAGSLPGSALMHVGLENASQETVNGFGFASIGVERLLQVPNASIVILNQNARTAEMLSRLDDNIFWRASPAVHAGKVHVSPPVSVFGGLTSATAFAEWLAATFDEAAG
jgi:iron complex transport system substrate-binding protein